MGDYSINFSDWSITYNNLFFSVVFEEISDDDKAFEHCMEDIILKLLNVKTMTDANEATRCEFILAILHASIAIAKKLTSQDIFIVLQKDVSCEDATGRVDYAIKSLEDLLCITEGKPRNIKIGCAQVGLLSTFSLSNILEILMMVYFLESGAT